MCKKIFAIGGGKNFQIYSQMFKLVEEKTPQLLLVPHGITPTKQQSNYDRMYTLFVSYFGCKMKLLRSDTLKNLKKTKELLDEADIVYVSEGNTLDMLEMWKKYGFDELLKEEWKKGKLLSGTSAGAVCWFSSFTTDSEGILQIEKGLDFIDAYITVHGQQQGMYDFFKNAIRNNSNPGILLTNQTAIEVQDEKCRFIISKEDTPFSSYFDKKSYAILSTFEDGQYCERKISNTTSLESVNKLLVYKR